MTSNELSLDLFGEEVPPVEEAPPLEVLSEVEVEEAPKPESPLVEEIADEEVALDLKTNESVDGQMAFIDFDEWWKVEWWGMPEFIQDDQTAWKTLLVHFQCREDMNEFAQLLGQSLTRETKFAWYPQQQREMLREKRYVNES